MHIIEILGGKVQGAPIEDTDYFNYVYVKLCHSRSNTPSALGLVDRTCGLTTCPRKGRQDP